MEDSTSRQAQISGWNCSRWTGLGLVGMVFVMVAVVSWRKWPDALVDFGMQLYLPWRISQGDVLYRDVMYVAGGPLSQYFNALLFRIFGVSFSTLIFANLAITAGMLVLIYRRFLAAADQVTATLICLGIVLVFAFQHFTPLGNYNYVTPYCHEIFHGLMLSLLVVMWLADWVEREKILSAVLAGFGSGLVFLTKPEVFLALAVCVAAGFFMGAYCHRRTRLAAKALAAFLFAGSAPLLVFYAIFLRSQGWLAGLRSVAAAWVPLWHTHIAGGPYYYWCLGLDRPFFYLGKMSLHIVFMVLGVAIYAMAFRTQTNKYLKPFNPSWLFRGMLLLPLLGLATLADWVECGTGLLFLMLCACGLALMNGLKHGLQPLLVFPLLWNIFSLMLLAKLGFFTRIWHYGFALAMPAFCGAIYLFTWLLPRRLAQKYHVSFSWFRLTACLVLIIGFVRLFLQSESNFLAKNIAVGGDGDRIMTYGPSANLMYENFRRTLSWIQQYVPPKATLAVLPEGAMINYLSRRVNPTVYPVWLPPEMEVFGQGAMTAAFQRNSPDYVVILERTTAEYGVGYFGYYDGYGTTLMDWIDKHYERVFPVPAVTAGSLPQKPPFAEFQILKKRQAAFE